MDRSWKFFDNSKGASSHKARCSSSWKKSSSSRHKLSGKKRITLKVWWTLFWASAYVFINFCVSLCYLEPNCCKKRGRILRLFLFTHFISFHIHLFTYLLTYLFILFHTLRYVTLLFFLYNGVRYNKRVLQRTVFIYKIRMLQRTQMPQRTRKNIIGRHSAHVRMTRRSFPLWLELQSPFLLSFVRFSYQFSSVQLSAYLYSV